MKTFGNFRCRNCFSFVDMCRILSAASMFIPECDLDQPPKAKIVSALLDAAAQLREAGLAARPFTVVTSRPDVVEELLSGNEAALADLTFTAQCVEAGSSPAQALCSRDDETVR